MVFSEYNRTVEAYLAIYMMVVALLFHFCSVLDFHVYDPMTEMFSPFVWSYLLASVSCGHMFSLWLNGKNKNISSPLRMITCISHVSVLAIIAYCSILSGVYWLTTTMCFLMLLLVKPMIGSLQRTAEVVRLNA